MKRITVAIMAATWLGYAWLAAGCAPMGVDPYALERQGNSLITAARELQTATADAYIAQMLDREATKGAGAAQTTATAQAIALDAERTVMALAVEQTQIAGQATQTAQALALQATASGGTAQAQQTAAAATPTAQAILLAQRVDEERAQQAKIMRWVWAVVLVMAGAGAIAAVLWTVWVAMNVFRKIRSRFSPDDLLVLDQSKDYRIVHPGRMTGPVITLTARTGVDASHPAPLEMQERHNAREQTLRAMVQAARMTPGLREAATQMTALPAGEAQPAQLPAGGATMAALDGWEIGQGLPLGMGEDGLVLANPETSPHFLFAGTTGSGKTRSGLRPLAAAALAAGWQVVIFDPSGLDFLPFKAHQNARLVTLSDASEAVGYLRALFELIRERQAKLAAAGVSTWSRLPGAGPEVLAVFDEFSNLADSLDNRDREELWRQARMVAAEGRKAGVHLAIALQDPTHKSLDLRIRRNMTGIAFRVRDQAASRVILNADGAETLPPRHFLAGLGLELIRGVGFSPDDGALRAWLGEHPAQRLPDPGWLEVKREREDRGGSGLVGILPETVKAIQELAADGLPATTIAERLFGYKGGHGYRAVRRVIDAWLEENDGVTGDEGDEVTGDEGA